MAEQKWFEGLRRQIKHRCGPGWGIDERHGGAEGLQKSHRSPGGAGPGWMSTGGDGDGIQSGQTMALDTADSGGHEKCLPQLLLCTGLCVDSDRWTRFKVP